MVNLRGENLIKCLRKKSNKREDVLSPDSQSLDDTGSTLNNEGLIAV